MAADIFQSSIPNPQSSIVNRQSSIPNLQSAIAKGVIPAAGLGTRLLPITRVIPKEMFPINQKPIIHHIVEEAITAGLTELAIILRPGKDMVREYFAGLSGDEWPGKIAIEYLYQPEPRGLGDAILCAKEFIGASPFIVLLPDDLYLDFNPTRELAILFSQYRSAMLCLGKVSPEHERFYGKVAVEACRAGEKLYRIAEMLPKNDGAPSPDRVYRNSFGRYLLTPTVFELSYERHPGVELDDGDLIRGLIRCETVYGLPFSCTRFDTGRFSTYAEAVAAFCARRDEQTARPCPEEDYADTDYQTLF